MSDIFISYAAEDRERAKPLAEVLTQQGWSVWWDPKISPGQEWDEVIEQQLEAARCVIVLWSRVSVASKWVKNEARDGNARGILVPILIEETKIPLEFRNIQAANLTGWDPQASRPDLNELLLELERRLGKPKQRQPGIVPHVEAASREVVGSEEPDAQAQQQAHEAQAQAEQAEQDARSIEGSVQGLAEADKAKAAGEQAKSAQYWGDAVTAFTAAKEQYARIVFCYAEEARKSMEKALASAEHQGVSAAPDALWQRARALVSEAEDLWNRQAFLKAGQTYSEAARLLGDITSEIERAKQEAEAKQSQVAILRERATQEEVEKYASGAFREAVRTERLGDTALSQGEYAQARELYLTAQQRYAQAQQQAQLERQRREALSVQEQAQQAEQGAIAVGASGELEVYRQAQAAREQGDGILARGAFAEAAAAYTHACRLYERAAEMQRQRARAAAEAARERALIAQAKAQGGAAAKIFVEQWAQAQTLLHEADTALSQDHDDTARAGFEKCAALFRHLYDQALVHIDRQQAEQARTHAFGLQRELGDAKGWRLVRAKWALARGQRLFESTNYAKARSSYEQAAALFTAWQRSAGQWTKLYPALALGAIVIGVTVYFTDLVQVREPESTPVLTKPKPPDPKEGTAAIKEAKQAALEKAREAAAAGRWTEPQQDNVVEYARQVLVLVPQHLEARQLIADAVKSTVTRAETSLEKGKAVIENSYIRR